MNFLKQCYQELDKLEYSEENIAELFSIANKVIAFLKSKNPNWKKENHALHWVMLTKDREFRRFKDKQQPDMRANFEAAKDNLKSDLFNDCREYWDPLEDTPWER
jgi:hypothetical protein